LAEQQESAGVIPYRGEDELRILLLQYPQGHWSFPKGHVEGGENYWETAVRELKEETDLDVVERDEDFKHVFDYTFSVDDRTIHKDVYYFSARVSNDSVSLSHEHQDYRWLDPDEVPQQITHENARAMFREWQSVVKPHSRSD
jgi:bis(5'-nucleosidyl)-tetraphosphatase